MSTIQDDDKFLVQRGTDSFKQNAVDLMSTIQDADLMLVQRGEDSFKVTCKDVKDQLGSGGGGPGVDPIISVNVTLTASSTYKPSTLTATAPSVINGTRVQEYPAWYRNGEAIPGATGYVYQVTESGSYKYEERWVGSNGVSVYPNASVSVNKSVVEKPIVLSPSNGAGQSGDQVVFPSTVAPTSVEDFPAEANHWSAPSVSSTNAWSEFLSSPGRGLAINGIYTKMQYTYDDSSPQYCISTATPFANLTEQNGVSPRLVITDCNVLGTDDGRSFSFGICSNNQSIASNVPGYDEHSAGWVLSPDVGEILVCRNGQNPVTYSGFTFNLPWDIWEIEIDYNLSKARLYKNGTHLTQLDVLLSTIPLGPIYGFSAGNANDMRTFSIGMGKPLKKLTFDDPRMFGAYNIALSGLTIADAFSGGDAVDFAQGDASKAFSGIVYGKPSDEELIIFPRAVALTRRPNPYMDEAWNAVAHYDGVWRAVSVKGKLMKSTDGINWELSGDLSQFGEIQWHGIAVAEIDGNPRWVVVGTTTGWVAWSNDGETWAQANFNTQGDSSVTLRAIAYGAGKFVAVSTKDGSTFGNIYYSTNGTTWDYVSALGACNFYGIGYGNGRFIACGWHDGANYAISDDGVNWRLKTTPAVNGEGTPGSSDLNDVSYSPELDRWVMVADTSDWRFYYSNDNGENFSPSETGYLNCSYYAVSWTGSMFIAMSGTSYEDKYLYPTNYYSKDGMKWEFIPGTAGTVKGAVFVSGQLVSVGSEGSAPKEAGNAHFSFPGSNADVEITDQPVYSRTQVNMSAPDPATMEFVGSTPASATGAITNDEWGDATWTLTNKRYGDVQTATKAIVPGQNQTFEVNGSSVNLIGGQNYDVTVRYDADDAVGAVSDANTFKTKAPVGWNLITLTDEQRFGLVAIEVNPDTGTVIAVSQTADNSLNQFGFLRSTDGGVSWEVKYCQNGSGDRYWNGVAYGNGKWIACGTDGDRTSSGGQPRSYNIAVSTDDGVTWNNVQLTNGVDLNCTDIAYNPAAQRFVIICSNAKNQLNPNGSVYPVIYSDANGENWTLTTSGIWNNQDSSSYLYSARKIRCVNNLFVAVRSINESNFSSASTPSYMYSSNGVSWTTGTITRQGSGVSAWPTGFCDVLYDGSQYYLINASTEYVVESNVQTKILWQGSSLGSMSLDTSCQYTVGDGGGKFSARCGFFKPDGTLFLTGGGPVDGGNCMVRDAGESTWRTIYIGSTSSYADWYDGVAINNDELIMVNYNKQYTAFTIDGGLSGTPGTSVYYDTNKLNPIFDQEIVRKHGVQPDLYEAKRLGYQELTEQPDYPVAGYELQADGRYKPIEDQQAEVRHLKAELLKSETKRAALMKVFMKEKEEEDGTA